MRTKPRRLGKWAHPLAIENEYVAVLVEVAAGVEAACRQWVMPALNELRLDDFGDIPESTGWYERMRPHIRVPPEGACRRVEDSTSRDAYGIP